MPVNPTPPPFAATMFDFYEAQSRFEEALRDAGFRAFSRIGGDDYDNSIEFYEVADDARMNDAAQLVVFDAKFSTAFVNHKDGWETHYNWDLRQPFKPSRGWRRKRSATGFLINYLPDGWGDQGRQWVESGYMTIVPDEAPHD